MTHDQLLQQQRDILRKMGAMRTMRRGTVSEQFLKVAHKGKAAPVRRGPYYLWQYWEHGKPMRRRLRGGLEVAAARREVAAYKEFEQLCQQYVRVAETLALAQRETATQGAPKKGLKSRSSRVRKSRG